MSVIEKPWGRLVVNDATGEATPVIKHRALYVEDPDFSLSTDSMVGSAFLVMLEGRMIWLGCVVAEPQAGTYLCHLDKLEAGARAVQRVFSLDTLMGLGEEAKRLVDGAIAEMKVSVVDPAVEWRFYDSLVEARAAFAEWTSTVGVKA
jgi:hypothetical protein